MFWYLYCLTVVATPAACERRHVFNPTEGEDGHLVAGPGNSAPDWLTQNVVMTSDMRGSVTIGQRGRNLNVALPNYIIYDRVKI